MGKYDEVRIDVTGYPIDWQMVEILAIDRRPGRFSARGRLLQHVGAECTVFFSVEDAEAPLDVGDVVSACFSLVSFFDIRVFDIRTLAVRWFRDERFAQPLAVKEHTVIDVPSSSASNAIRGRREVSSRTVLIKREEAPKWLKKVSEKRRDTSQSRKTKQRPVHRGREPAPPAPFPTVTEPPVHAEIDRQKMIELLSKRFRITMRKEE